MCGKRQKSKLWKPWECTHERGGKTNSIEAFQRGGGDLQQLSTSSRSEQRRTGARSGTAVYTRSCPYVQDSRWLSLTPGRWATAKQQRSTSVGKKALWGRDVLQNQRRRRLCTPSDKCGFHQSPENHQPGPLSTVLFHTSKV